MFRARLRFFVMSAELEIQSGVREISGQTFSWNGAQFACAAGVERVGVEPNEHGGFDRVTTLVLYVARDAFGLTAPTSRQRVVFNARDYIVDGVAQTPGGAVLALHLISAR